MNNAGRSHEIMSRWVSLLAGSGIAFALASVPMTQVFLISTLFILAYLIRAQVMAEAVMVKHMWLSKYLLPTSPLRYFFDSSSFIRTASWVVSGVLSIVAYIGLYSYGTWEVVGIIIGLTLATVIHNEFRHIIDDNIATAIAHIIHFRVYRWLAVSLAVAGLLTAKVIRESGIDYTQASPDQIASDVITAGNHPVKVVQHCVRAIDYIDRELVRIRDNLPQPFGWLIYVALLLPNTVPVIGCVYVFMGIEQVLLCVSVIAFKTRD